uniref:Uncharacterized protein n=1 Tax=Laurencia verruciformis TaxID=3073068 RepID=A0AA51NFA8_9FLOR|nr:hypothetical protein [Laurencia verruciformis]
MNQCSYTSLFYNFCIKILINNFSLEYFIDDIIMLIFIVYLLVLNKYLCSK